jgi:hypothetical protein
MPPADKTSFVEEVSKRSEFPGFLVNLRLMPNGVIDAVLGDESVAKSDPGEKMVGFSVDGEGLSPQQEPELSGGDQVQVDQGIPQS